MTNEELNVKIGPYTLMVGKRSKRRVNPGARGWLVLGKVDEARRFCPTLGWGVIDGFGVRVRGGMVPPSVMKKLVELARDSLTERGPASV